VLLVVLPPADPHRVNWLPQRGQRFRPFVVAKRQLEHPMTAADIVAELKPLGLDSYKNVLLKHGIREPVFGVKIEHLKKIQKRIKKDYRLALELYDTGIYDAMYLAGLLADDPLMTKKDLERWVDKAYCPVLAECTVAWVAAEGQHGHELALKWIDSKKEQVAAAGWATLSSLAVITPDDQLDLPALKKLLVRIEKTIQQQLNRVRYVMNNFVIAVGGHVMPLTEAALATADRIGPVTVDMGDTECKVPSARAQIEKIRQRGALGKKRKTAKC
jgi:3-methyladenine DNA glycosylase AlkD